MSAYVDDISENRRDDLMRVIRGAVEQPGRASVGRPIDEAVADAVIAWIDSGGVVVEEPEWEYGVRLTGGDRDRRTAGYIYRWPSLAQAEDQAALNFDASAEFFTRIKAGPWVPVKQEGAETDA